MNADDGAHFQSAVNMRKQLRTAFQVFFHKRTTQCRGVDLQNDEIRAASENPICDRQDLMRIGTMDEAFSRKSFGFVDAVLRGDHCLGL